MYNNGCCYNVYFVERKRISHFDPDLNPKFWKTYAKSTKRLNCNSMRLVPGRSIPGVIVGIAPEIHRIEPDMKLILRCPETLFDKIAQ